jgi:CRISPR-associated endonuclease Csn1
MASQLILGLDIGVASIGWAIVREYDIEHSEVLQMGVRIVPANLNNQTELDNFSKGKAYSTNQSRRQKRGARRNFARYILRRQKLIALLQTNNLYPTEQLRLQLTASQLWSLRAKAATEQVSLAELGRVLLHLNQKRGYKSSRKGRSNDAEEGKYLLKIRELDQLLQNNKQTIGQFFATQFEQNPHAVVKKKIFSRASYRAEFDQIWQTQQVFYPAILTDTLRKQIGDETIFHQRPLKTQKDKVAFCQFEKHHRVSPISSPLYQQYRSWQKVHDLRITDKKGNAYTLSVEEKQQIFDALQTTDKLTVSQIFKILGLTARLYRANVKDVIGNRTVSKLARVLGNESPLLAFGTTDVLEQQPLYRLWHLLYSVEDTDILNNKLQQAPYHIEPAIAETLSEEVFFEEGFGSLSSRAIRKLLPHLSNGLDYTNACEAVGYRHADYETKEEKEQRVLNNSLALIKKDSLRNPIVEKIVNQVINLVNEIMPTFGQPDQIRVELARSLRENAEQRANTDKKMRDREKENKGIVEKLYEKYKRRITPKIVEKYRLWQETGGISPYNPTHCIAEEAMLWSGDYDIEHIVPKALFFDNSFANKTIAPRHINEQKSDMTGFDFMKNKGDEALKAYTELIHQLFDKGSISKAKRDRLLMAEKDIPEDFLNRQLQETRYITKVVSKILKQVCREVSTTTGAITDYLRHQWGLDDVLKTINLPKYQAAQQVVEHTDIYGKVYYQILDWSKRDDHRNHAIDALVVALTKQGYIQRLNELHKLYPHYKALKDDEKVSLRHFPLPHPHLVREAIKATAAILVSHKAGQKSATWKTNKETGKRTLVPRGALHEETIYGKANGRYTVRYDLDIKFDKVENIIDKHVRELVTQRLEAFDNNPKKAFQDLENNPIYLNEAQGIIIKKVTCKAHLNEAQGWNNSNSKPNGFVKLGNNHHAAFYQNNKGKIEDEVVSFWEAVERKKQGLPVVHTEPSDGRTFVFSMQKNDMFVFGLSREELQDAINRNDNKLIGKHLYRVQRFTKSIGKAFGDYYFRLHTETKSDKADAVARNLKIFIQVQSATNITGIKVKINRLGQVEKLLS